MSIRQQAAMLPAIIDLIRPLEEAGILLNSHSREYLENHIREFFVLEHDRQICIALR